MYAGTQFNWIDKSTITKIENTVVDNSPIFAQTFTSEMGSEEWGVFNADNFFDMFGTDISFAKHGQPLIQAANIVNNGGRVLAKRVVAADSKLANIVLVAEIYQAERQKTDVVSGDPIYVQEDGTEGTTVTATPVMENYAVLSWKASSVENASTFTEVENMFEDTSIYIPDGVEKEVDGKHVTVFSYPLFVITDNGRGVSTKKIRLGADYEVSKSLQFTMSNLYVMKGMEDVEGIRFTGDAEIIYAGNNYSITNQGKTMTQIKVKGNESISEEFILKLAELAGVEADDLRKEDFLLGKTRKGKQLSYLTIDTENGIDVTSEFGIALLNGDNGSFGTHPFGKEEYITESVKAWNGKFSDVIWDRDTYKIAAVFDANYPAKIKRAIEYLSGWRKDFMFFEDIGLGINTYESIYMATEEICLGIDEENRKFTTPYLTSYDIKDPFTKRQIPVTICYSLAKLMIPHFVNGAYRPIAGLNGFTIPEAIEGTINFAPKITPTVNQKSLLEELRINYATYVEGKLVIETMYTAQDAWTQLSFANNVLAVQEVARAIRTLCPSIRYSFIDAAGLEMYKAHIQNLLINYESNFETLNFVYVEDRVMVTNKVFKAALEFGFRNFAQTEIFDLIAIPVE